MYCTPYWNAAEPGKCVSYATRRWSAELFNVHYDRNRACRETPIELPGGVKFESPTACHLSPWGVRGEWFVRNDEDAECIPQWARFRAGHCKSYDVREYIAHLMHVNYNPWTACRDTPMEIHGRHQDKPHECRFNKHGEMEGVWHVLDERYCRPHWGHVKNDGCAGAGFRRFASRLWGIHSANWAAMCKTTPIVLAGQTLTGAMRCVNKHVMGMWGQWFLPDEGCTHFDAEEFDTDPTES
ncbi:hypothetical protein AURDEDRAFT_110155 [Auricularia subglabra TFB-10046 SS5]|nr:hypothetical protein AURDEDRAFT_110155 [Auricularia subglabra TFB-10046 SS5]